MQTAIKNPITSTKIKTGDWVTFGIIFVSLALLLLPIERFEFFTGIRVIDFVLFPLIAFGLLNMWLANQRFYMPLLWPAGVIIIASLIATMTGTNYERGITTITQELYLIAWFSVVTNLLIQSSLQGMDTMAKIWSIIALIESAATVMGMLHIGPYIFYTEPLRGYVITSGGMNRGIGTFVNPNATAAYLSISLFIVMTTKWPKLPKTIFALLILAGLYATGSMGAILSTVSGMLVLVIIFAYMQNPRRVRFWIGLLLICSSLFLFAGVISGSVLLKSLQSLPEARWLMLTIGRLPSSVLSRTELMQYGWGLFKLHPLGIGPGTCDLHNDYIAFLFERGPLGLIGWLWLIATGLLTCWKTAWAQNISFHRWQVLALGAAFLSTMVNSLSHEVFHFRQVWMLMAFLFASCILLTIPQRSIVTVHKSIKRG